MMNIKIEEGETKKYILRNQGETRIKKTTKDVSK